MMKYCEKHKKNFEKALDHYLSNEHKRYNIGTYRESSLHMILKYFISDDESEHEKNINGHIADVFSDGIIYEIQTAGFARLKEKLYDFSDEYKVVVVYPVCVKKTVSRIDAETGEIIGKRVSPLKGKDTDIFQELCYIKDFLSNKNLSFFIFFYEGEQIKVNEKNIKVGKKRTDKYDTVPLKYVGYTKLECRDDYMEFIPSDLPYVFTLNEYIASTGRRRMTASAILYASKHAGAVIQCGKKGRENLYKRYYTET